MIVNKFLPLTPIDQFSIAFFVIILIFIVIFDGMDMD